MRLLVVGGNGQVGRELRRSLRALGEVVATTRDGMLEDGGACVAADLSDPASLAARVRELAPAAVVNAAAYTAVDKAESDAVNAFRINAEAPGALARACAAADVPLVHYSTYPVLPLAWVTKVMARKAPGHHSGQVHRHHAGLA